MRNRSLGEMLRTDEEDAGDAACLFCAVRDFLQEHSTMEDPKLVEPVAAILAVGILATRGR